MEPSGRRWSKSQQEYYEAHVEDYEQERKLRGRAYARKARILRRVLEECHSREVLEVGAGTGLVTSFLAPSLPVTRYVALDLSRTMLEAARARNRAQSLQFVVADVCATGLADERFDAIVGVDIIHHLDSPTSALQEWRRVARPGARLALLESNPYHPVSLAFIGVEHEVRLFLNSWGNLLRWAHDAGWGDVTLQATPTFTPSGPSVLGGVLSAIDHLALRLPGSRWAAALWLLTGRK